MSSGQTKPDACIGCYNYMQSWAAYPYIDCTRDGGSGRQFDYYKPIEDVSVTEQMNNVQYDAVVRPSHYMLCDIEAIEVIKATLTSEQYKGYLLGNCMKYRLRAGKKDDAEQDIRKALEYEEMFDANFGK